MSIKILLPILVIGMVLLTACTMPAAAPTQSVVPSETATTVPSSVLLPVTPSESAPLRKPASQPTIPAKQPGAYPRLANYYHIPISINQLVASSLARWDLIVVNYHVIFTSADSLKLIKQLNPDIKILAWISAGLGGNQLFSANPDEDWFLHYADSPSNPKPPAERRVISWSDKTGTNQVPGMNPASEWSTQLASYVHDSLMSSGLIDGVFYDCTWETVNQPNIDINNDSVAESSAVVNQKYQEGMAHLLSLTRELLGPNAIIIGNPGVEWTNGSPYWDYANGQMQENALGTMFGSSWPKIWDIYQRNMQKQSPPTRIHWIAADTNQQVYDNLKPNLTSADLQKMRFGFGITLLGDGYFGFDEGDGLHGQLWWFPEYDANLGLAKEDAIKRTDGTWVREFEYGTVLVNPNNVESTIDFTGMHEDLSAGVKDSHFIIPAKDSRILIALK